VLWIVFGLLASTVVWWNFWSFRHTEWNYFSFLLGLTVPAVLYLLAAALVPDQPSRISSWYDHFYAARTRIFIALIFFFLAVFTITFVLLDLPILHPVRGAQLCALAFATLGVVSKHKRIHSALPILFLGILLTATSILFLRPDAIASVASPN
jgi:multisubunit Na+/H+ antiporter MnhE subunit